jgi:8-amino-7-oxononanoate synthase
MRDLAAELARLRTEHLYRSRAVVDGPQGAEITVNGTRYLSFCSNDYLGLANHPRVVAALEEGAEKYGAGSGASHLVTGHQRAHHALEEALAAFTGRPRALLFSSGYLANLGTVAALAGRGELVWEDRLNHASLLDAGLLSGARLHRYPHGDTGALRQRLMENAGRHAMIITDGVFSMDGDLAPLPQLADIAQRHDAWLMVDDAHGLGVLGAGGRGTLEHFGLDATAVPVLIGTLGKAFGTFGAFVAGSEDLIEYLIQHARPYVYTTALPPALAHATLASLRILQEEGWRREHLQNLITRFRRGAEQLGMQLLPSPTPIQALLVGRSEQALGLSAALRQHGIYVSAIRPPTVPKGTARLRITLSAAHSEAQVDRLLSALETVS